MNNIYYYAFYIFFRVRRKTADQTPEFTAFVIVSIPIFLNLLSIIIFFGGFDYCESKKYMTLLGASIALITLLINIHFLINKKADRIYAFFAEKYKEKKHNVGLTLVVVLYFVFSIAACVFIKVNNKK